MDHTKKTTEQLLSYIAELEKRVAGLEKNEIERNVLEEALKKSEEQYRILFENAPISIYRTSPEGRFLNANTVTASLNGYASSEEMVNSIKDIGTQLYARQEDRREVMRRLREDGFIRDFEVQFRKKDGTLRWGLLNAIEIRDNNGNVICYEGTSQDITDRKIIEDKLRQSEEKYHTFLDNAIDPVLMLNPKGHIIESNKKAEELLCYTKKELYRMNIKKIYAKKELENIISLFREAANGRPYYSNNTHVLRKDGRLIPVGLKSAAIEYAGQQVIQIIFRDITELKQTEAALLDSENKFRCLVERSNAGVYLIQDGLFKYSNDCFAEMLGYTVEEFVNKIGPEDIIYPDDYYGFSSENIRKRLEGETGSICYELRLVARSGKIMYTEAYGSNVMYEGRPAVIGTIVDRTAKKDLELELQKHQEHLKHLVEERTMALKESEARYSGLVNNALLCVAQTNLEGDILFVNNKCVEMLNFKTKEEAASANIVALFKSPEDWKTIIRKIRKSGKIENYTATILTNAGKSIDLLLNITLQGNVISIMALDITEQENTLRNLLESENKFKDLAEKSFTGIYLVQNDLFQYVNTKFVQIFGYRKKDVEGKTGPEKVVIPEDLPLIKERINEGISGKRMSSQVEFRGITKNNKILNIEVFISRTIYKGKPAVIGAILDITERKLAHEALMERERELAVKSKTLKELNVTLKVLLKQMGMDKKALEEKFVSNVKNHVLPYIEKIQKHRLDIEQKAYVNIIETNLRNIISPFLDTVRQFDFTPKEMEVATLIKAKKSTKEIAEIMNVSPCAVDAHRNKIRKKLGLNNKKTNLQSYLQGLK